MLTTALVVQPIAGTDLSGSTISFSAQRTGLLDRVGRICLQYSEADSWSRDLSQVDMKKGTFGRV